MSQNDAIILESILVFFEMLSLYSEVSYDHEDFPHHFDSQDLSCVHHSNRTGFHSFHPSASLVVVIEKHCDFLWSSITRNQFIKYGRRADRLESGWSAPKSSYKKNKQTLKWRIKMEDFCSATKNSINDQYSLSSYRILNVTMSVQLTLCWSCFRY